MSPRYSQSAGDSRPAEDDRRSFTTGIGSMVAPTADDEAALPTRPTFTARPTAPTVAPVPEPALAPDDATVPELDPVPDGAAEPETTVPVAPALGPDDGAAEPGAGLAPADGARMRPQPLPATAGLDEPLLSDAAGLRARWQRVQAGFVDDPQEAVGDAADLIEQTAQAMVGALRQRQRQLRVMWERGPADDSAPADGESAARGSDTEHLRQMMQRYRALFNQLCRP
jgi:hypothetical protein